ncbi:MAG: RNA chaperone Hfq [Sporomusaceae bacterium]|nr:RNA chaperone Hfq [Sporomusaceae bacterium]
MITKVINLQDSFLNQIRKENNLPVIIYLINGFQLRGVVKGFDNFTVIIENDGKQQLVYKHAISTITPLRQLASAFHEKKEDKQVDKQS